MPDPNAFLAAHRALVWIVVITKPNQEIIAKRHLEDQGFEVYLPMKLYEDRWRNLRSTAFFPRYLFARIDAKGDQWPRIFSTVGVTSVLGATAMKPPTGIANFVIERLRAQEEAGYIRMMGEAQKVAPVFSEGEIVRIAGSPLEAVFLEPVDAKRGLILVSLLGRESRLTVDLVKLRTASDL